MMTARKRVGPLPTHRLAVRHSANHSSSDSSSDFHSDASSDSSLRHSLLDHSSPGFFYVSTSAGGISTNDVRVKDSGYLTDVEVDPREISLRDDVIVKASDEPHLEQDINLDIQAEIDESMDMMKMPNTRSGASMTHEEVEELVTRQVAEEMEDREAARTLEPLNKNGDELEGENEGNGNGGNGGNENGGNRNGGNGENRNGNRNGNHGVVGLTRWFEKIETMFNISNCSLKYQVKYATCTLQDSALTWWNYHKRTIGVEAAYTMNRVELIKLMTEVFCTKNESRGLMVPDEEDKVERFIGGLPDNIQGNVIAANPARLQDAIRIANQLMDKKVHGVMLARNRVHENRGGWRIT
ncbi:hypothetical protein Tco_0639340 [Tanacetum coccineum]